MKSRLIHKTIILLSALMVISLRVAGPAHAEDILNQAPEAGFESPELTPAEPPDSLAFLQESGDFPDTYTLETAVEWALAHNREIERLRLEVEAAEAAEHGSRLLYMPTLDLGGRSMSMGPAGSMEIPGPGDQPIVIETSSTDITNTLFLTLTQPVYMFGTFSLARRGASLGLDQTRLQLARAEQTIRREVEEAFLQAALAQAMLGVQEQAVATAGERLRLAKVRFDAGDVARFEVLRSEVGLATAREELLGMETAAKLAMSAFVQKLGLPSGTHVTISPPDPETVEPLSPEISMVDAWETALANRMDLKALEVAVELLEIGVQSGRNRPSLIFQGNYSYSDRSSGFSDKESWNVVLNLSYSLFDSGRADAAMDEARARRDAISVQAEEMRTLVALEVEGAYRSLVESLERISTARATLATAREALRIAELGYSEGVIPYIDYQDADLGYRQAETYHLQAVYQFLIAESSLRAAMGVE